MARTAVAVPRFHRRPEARAEELIDAALLVFGERGFRRTTLAEVAARAGVSKGTVYLYFASKDALFRAVVQNRVVTLIAAAEAAAQRHDGSVADLLVDVICRMWDAMSRPDMVCMGRLVQSEMLQFPEVRRFYFEHVIQRHRRLLHAVAARGVATGEFHRRALIVVPRMVPSFVLQLNQTRSMFGDLDRSTPAPETLRDTLIALLLEGIRAPAPKPVRRRRSKRVRGDS